MRNISNAILKLIAIILVILTIPTTVFVLFLSSFNRILLISQTYQRAFSLNKVYEQLPAVASEEFMLVRNVLLETCAEPVIANSCINTPVNTSQTDGIEEIGGLGLEGRAFLRGMNEEQWSALMLHLLTADVTQESIESMMNETIAYVKGETDTVTMPLMNLKARLSTMTDDELTQILLNSQPSCNLDQQAFIMSGGLGEIGSPPVFCSASGGTSQVLVLDLQRRLTAAAAEIPDHETLIEAPSPSNPPSLQRFIGRDLQATLQSIHAISQYLPFLPFALLILVALFGVRSLRGLLRWWGIPIFIAGLFTLIPGMIIFFLFDQIWLNYVLNDLPPLLTSGFGEIIYGVMHSLTNDLSKRMMLEGGILTLLALGVIFISTRVPPPPDPSLPPLAQPGTPGGPVLNPNRKKKRW